MIAIRSLDDLEQTALSPGVRRAARDAIANLVDAFTEPGRPYDPDADGHVIVLDDPADNEALRHVSARISHQASTAVADPGMPTALRSVGHPHRSFNYASGALRSRALYPHPAAPPRDGSW